METRIQHQKNMSWTDKSIFLWREKRFNISPRIFFLGNCSLMKENEEAVLKVQRTNTTYFDSKQ